MTLALLPLLAALGATAPTPTGCADVDEPAVAWCEAVSARPRLGLPTASDRAALVDVYARPELRRARLDTTALRRLLAGLWARILEALGTTEAEQYASLGRAVFIGAGLAAAVAALAALRRRRATGAAPPTAPVDARAPLPPPDESAASAREALARGDLTSAVRHALLSALAALERAGLIPRDRTLTNAELADRLEDRSLAAEFAALAVGFDRAVYGGVRVEPGEARAQVERAARIAAGGRA